MRIQQFSYPLYFPNGTILHKILPWLLWEFAYTVAIKQNIPKKYPDKTGYGGLSGEHIQLCAEGARQNAESLRQTDRDAWKCYAEQSFWNAPLKLDALGVQIFMAKKGSKFKKYSSEFKISVIVDMREHHLGYRETMRKYFPEKASKDYGFIRKWERIYLEEGAEGLMKERRGKAGSATGTRKGRPPKLDKQVEEDLIAENQRLRMEIEYLKKLSALVLADEQKNGKKQK